MNEKPPLKSKIDISFIISLAGIIILAIYLGINQFKAYDISEYLDGVGETLLAKISDKNNHEHLLASYEML